MNIQTKTFSIISTVFLILMICFTIIMKSVLLEGFLELEQRDIHNKTQRVKNVILMELESLKTLVVDWAIWDDSYYFITSRDKEFINSNLIDDTFTWNKLDFIIFIDNKGKLVFGHEYNPTVEIQSPVSKEILEHFHSDRQILPFEYKPGTKSGLISTSSGTFLIASSEILKSDSSGTPSGILVMGRKLSDEFISGVSTTLNLEISTYTGSKLLNQTNLKTINTLGESQNSVIETYGDNSISGFSLLNDIYQKPTLLFSVHVNRDIYQQGLTTYRYMIYVTATTALILIFTMVVMIRKMIIKKLANITRHLKIINSSEPLKLNTKNSDKDEIGSLSQAINETLENIKQVANELGVEKKLAEQTSLRKSKFLSHFAQEIHTPLNSIIGFAALSFENKIDLSTKENLRQIAKAGHHLLELVDNLLDLAKIESGNFDISNEHVNLNNIIEKSVLIVQPLEEEFEKFIKIRCTDGSDIFVHADHKLLKQVFVNILTNEIKYNRPSGTIEISCEESYPHKIRIIFNNFGTSIRSNLLDNDAVCDENASENHGTGMNLSTTKMLIEAMNGSMWVKNEYGAGSHIIVELNTVN